MDEEITAGGKDKAALVAWIRQAAERYRPTGVVASVLDTTVSGDRAAARVRVTATTSYGRWPVDAKVDLVRRHEGWKISGVSDVAPASLVR